MKDGAWRAMHSALAQHSGGRVVRGSVPKPRSNMQGQRNVGGYEFLGKKILRRFRMDPLPLQALVVKLRLLKATLVISAWRLLCSPFLVLTCFLILDEIILTTQKGTA